MKNIHFHTSMVLLMAILLAGCNWFKKDVKLPDLPQLKSDTLNSFKTGDRFIFFESTNSCCLNCFMKDSVLSNHIPPSPLYKHVETIADLADPDCAGCSSYYYHIMECIASGTDTLFYYTIPMGAAVFSECEQINRRVLQTDVQKSSFIIIVSE
jgi:hypothetical protein